MGKTCVVRNCPWSGHRHKNTKKKKSIGKKPKMYKFPTKYERREEWKKQLPSGSKQVTDKSFICANHFVQNDFTNGSGKQRKRIHKDAVPTVFGEINNTHRRKRNTYLASSSEKRLRISKILKRKSNLKKRIKRLKRIKEEEFSSVEEMEEKEHVTAKHKRQRCIRRLLC